MTPLLTDSDVIDILLALRSREWPPGADARAEAIQVSFDQLLRTFSAKGLKTMLIALDASP